MSDHPDDAPAERVAELHSAFLEAATDSHLGVAAAYLDERPARVFCANGAAAELLGYEPGELLGVPPLDHVSAALLPALREFRREHASRDEPTATLELAVRRGDGTEIPLEVTHRRTRVGGRPVAVVVFRDISARRRALTALRAADDRFRSVVESAPDGVVILRGARIVYLNPAAAELLGLSRATDGLGRSILDLLQPESAELARERLGQINETGAPLRGPAEYRPLRADGKEILVELSSLPIDYEGAPAVLGFARDITERRAIREQLVQADRLAAVGTLAAGIAHEINNPLAYVLLGLQLLRRELPRLGGDPERTAELLGRLADVENGAERVGTIVRDLKTFARADDLQRGPVDLRASVEAALRIADNELRHHARVVKDFASVPPIDGNAARLEQVVLNLLVNAAHAFGGGPGERNEVRISLRAAGDGAVELEVADNGDGIGPDVLPHVFDPFFTTKPIGVGTGLGLSICRNIVEAAGGTIRIESTPGAGTTVRVTLRAAAPRAAPPTSAGPVSLAPPSAPQRRRLLVVDDEPLVTAILNRLLARDHDVQVASSAPDALALIEREAFDAILCDVMMPGMTGPDLHASLAARDADLADRVVFMTGGAFLPRIAESLAALPNPKLEKPIDLDALEGALQSVIRRARRRQRAAPVPGA